MDNFFWLIVASLAAWRLTSILYREKIANRIRYWAGERHDPHTNKESYPDTFVGKLFACFWCLSVWTGMIIVVIWFICPAILLPLALSAVSILVDQRIE